MIYLYLFGTCFHFIYVFMIIRKYFKVDGKSPKMRYISTLRKEFGEKNLDVVFATFELLKKKGMILIDGNNSHISKSGIAYYHKNIQV